MEHTRKRDTKEGRAAAGSNRGTSWHPYVEYKVRINRRQPLDTIEAPGGTKAERRWKLPKTHYRKADNKASDTQKQQQER